VSKVLIVCNDRVARTMAGPAIRCWEMASLLAAHGHDVHLSVPRHSQPEPAPFQVFIGSERALAEEERWADVLVVQGFVLAKNPTLARTRKHLVVDLYDPYPIETLEAHANRSLDYQVSNYWPTLATLMVQLQVGDFFLCASERQRDFWMGSLLTANRLNPSTLGQDRLMRKLIDVAPFGTASEPPRHSGRPAARGVLQGIEQDSKLAIWAGGVYNWFDPLSLVSAWPTVLRAVPEARLLFLGMRHPNPMNPKMEIAAQTVRLADELGLRDRGIVFNSEWVPYDRRQDFLLEADLGVSTHFENLETRLSFRTRFLDYIWAGLPCVATEGDVFADWVAANGTGRVVPYRDSEAIAAAMVELFTDDSERRACAERVIACRPLYTWEHALAPLLRYCDEPWFAADLGGRRDPGRSSGLVGGGLQPPGGVLGRTVWFLRKEGPLPLIRRSLRKLRRELAASRR
jgi:glycosyltransferase involved in cell wall biosynthesis